MILEKRIQRDIAVLDNHIKMWYKKNFPEDKEQYASLHLASYEDFDARINRLTVQIGEDKYKDLVYREVKK